MSRTKKIPFADALDIFLETAPEEEIRDAIASVKAWAQQRKFGFRVRIEPINTPEPKSANGTHAADHSTPEAKQ